MYFLDIKQHHKPHIHVRYAEDEAIYQIPEGILLEGSLPANKHKLIIAWIEIHQINLMNDWKLAVTGNPVFNIEPLK